MINAFLNAFQAKTWYLLKNNRFIFISVFLSISVFSVRSVFLIFFHIQHNDRHVVAPSSL